MRNTVVTCFSRLTAVDELFDWRHVVNESGPNKAPKQLEMNME